MKTRLDKLVMVREAASRSASGAYAESVARVAQHEGLAARLEGAAAMLTPETGAVAGGSLGAQLELAIRMRAARLVAQSRVDGALAERGEAAVARQAARRALDAAKDACRADRQAGVARREARLVPMVSKDRI